jgi:hypothetical protein
MTEVPRITTLPHTYAIARLHTTDNGKQISLRTVEEELGQNLGSEPGSEWMPESALPWRIRCGRFPTNPQ